MTHSVDVLRGTLILEDEQDLDFTLDAPLPLVWQRKYSSENAFVSWFGQGWSIPLLTDRLEINHGFEAVDYLDARGIRTLFDDLKIGQKFYSHYRHITLKRTGRNAYDIVFEADGTCLHFGLLPRDKARILAQGEDPEDNTAPRAPAQTDTLFPISLTDRNGNAIRLEYDDNDIPTRILSSTGRGVALTFERSRSKKPRLTCIREITRNGSTNRVLVQYRYNREGDLIEVIDGQGRICRTFRWDKHLLIEEGAPEGITSCYQYDRLDSRGNIVAVTTSNGQTWRFEYDPEELFTRAIDGEGRVFDTWSDEERLRPVLERDPLGHETRYEYDPFGNLLTETDALGRVTKRAFDGLSRPEAIILPDGSNWLIEWDESSELPLLVTDPLGFETEFAYDKRGNLIRETDAAGNVTAYELDERGLVTQITDARGGIKRLTYDEDGRAASYTDCSDKTTRYHYHPDGTLAAITDAAGHTTSYQWEWINRQARLSTVKHPDGSTERFAYGPQGQLVAYHDPLGHATLWRLNPDGTPIERRDALEHSLTYAYDRHGRLTSLTNENGAHYHFQWDKADRLITEIGFDGRAQHYTYNEADEVVSSRDGPDEGPHILTHYKRDPLGRLLLKTAIRPDTGTDRHQVRRTYFTWDKAGQLETARNLHAKVLFDYTPTGEIAKETTLSRNKTRSELTHQYDPLGHRVRTTLPDGRTLNHLTYGNGHVHQINIDGKVISDIERDDLHRETKRTQGTLESLYTLDAMGRLLASRTTQRDQTTNTTTGQKIARRYSYDKGGRLTQIEDAIGGITRYGYDALGRLLQAVSPKHSERFAFDPAHNLIDPNNPEQKSREWTDEEWAEYVREHIDDPTFNPLERPKKQAPLPNRLMTYEEHRYEYDTWGNCTKKKSGAHITRTFKWDANHRLTSATIKDKNKERTEHWHYQYDPLGRRISKRKVDEQKNTLEEIRFFWDGNRLLGEDRENRRQVYLYEPESFVPLALVRSEATDTTPRDELETLPLETPEHIANDLGRIQEMLRVAMLVSGEEPEPEPPEGEVFYIHADQIGTPREVTNAEGNLVWRAEYRAWGRAQSIERPHDRNSVFLLIQN